MEESRALVYGEITLAGNGSVFDDATVTVLLEDVSKIDAASATVVEQVIGKVTSTDMPLSFQLSGPPLDEGSSYTLSVHVDVNSNGTLNPGDYLTLQNYPVDPLNTPQYHVVQVHLI